MNGEGEGPPAFGPQDNGSRSVRSAACFAQAGIEVEEIDLVIPHQANVRI